MRSDASSDSYSCRTVLMVMPLVAASGFRRIRKSAGVEQKFINVADSFLKQFPGSVARSPPRLRLVFGRKPADDANPGAVRVDFGENQSASSGVRAKREHVQSLGRDTGIPERSPNRARRFKCSVAFGIFGGCDHYSFLRDAQSNHLACSHLCITCGFVFPKAGSQATTRDDVAITAVLELIDGGADALPTNPAFHYENVGRDSVRQRQV
jgi:hypothetical protein